MTVFTKFEVWCFVSSFVVKIATFAKPKTVSCKLKKMTTDEIKTLAKKKKQEGDIDEALNLYKQLWELEKNEWNGYFLAQCLRKSDNYTEARELHNALEKVYPN